MPSPLAPTQFDPERIKIDPKTGTVEGRVANIISGGGPLQQISETKALQFANRRGLLNTSIALGEAQKARAESALPIASQDVQTSFESQLANQAAANRAKEFGAGYFQRLGEIGATGEQQRLNIGASGEVELTLMDRKSQIDKELLTASADEQLRLISEQGTIDTQLQNLRGSQALTQIGAQGEINKQLVALRHTNVQDIMARQEASDSRLQAERAEISKQLIGTEGDVKEGLLRQQGLLDMELAQERGDIAKELQSELGVINSDLEALRAGFTSENLADQRTHETELTELRAGLEEQLQGLIGSNALELQGLRGEQALNLSTLENDYDTMLSTQRNAAALFTQTSSDIGQILANPDIPITGKTALIDQLTNLLSTSLSLMGSITDMDLVGLLDFGANSGTGIAGPLVGVPYVGKTGSRG